MLHKNSLKNYLIFNVLCISLSLMAEHNSYADQFHAACEIDYAIKNAPHIKKQHPQDEQLKEDEQVELDKLGIEPVSPVNEQFIKSVQQEMGLEHVELTIRKMNNDAIALVGRENAFVIGGYNYMFISQDWFDELSIAEKRFLIGHELAHLMMDHSQKKQLAHQAMNVTVDYIMYLIGNNAPKDTFAHKGIEFAKKFGFGTLKLLLLSLLSKGCEWQADEISVMKLKSAPGGIALFERMLGQKNDEEASSFIKFVRTLINCFASHPSLKERIAYLRSQIDDQNKDNVKKETKV